MAISLAPQRWQCVKRILRRQQGNKPPVKIFLNWIHTIVHLNRQYALGRATQYFPFLNAVTTKLVSKVPTARHLLSDQTLGQPGFPALVPPPRRLGRGRAASALLVAAAHAQPLLGAVLELAVEVVRGVLAVDEVAEAAAHAAVARVEPAARLPEVGHGAELAVDGARRVPPRVELVAGLLRRVFVLEARVDVADQV